MVKWVVITLKKIKLATNVDLISDNYRNVFLHDVIIIWPLANRKLIIEAFLRLDAIEEIAPTRNYRLS